MAARVHGGINVTLKGEAKVRHAIRALALANRADEAGKAIDAEMALELAESQERAPLGKTGRLRASGRLVPTVMTQSGAGEINFVSRIVYGLGPDNVLYAVAQHEKLQYQHDEGQAKYLESVIRESRPFMAARIGRRLIALFSRVPA